MTKNEFLDKWIKNIPSDQKFTFQSDLKELNSECLQCLMREIRHERRRFYGDIRK